MYVDDSSFDLYQQLNDPCIYLIRENFQHMSRTHRLAHGRNELIRYLSMFVDIRDEDPKNVYIIMIDPDSANAHHFNMNVFEDVMSNNSMWDSLSFYRHFFYDIWALRYGPYDYNNAYKQINGTWAVPMIKEAIKQDMMNANTSYFPVYSAFNGMAIYKYDKTIGCKYIGRNPKDESYIGEDCEHVSFHKCMIKKHKAKIRIYNESITGV